MLWRKGFLVSVFFLLLVLSLSLFLGAYYWSLIFFFLFVGLLLVYFLFYHFHSSKICSDFKDKDDLSMLRDYLRKALVSGYDDKKVSQALVNAGWNPKLVKGELHKLRFF